jgi:hypothetical protein
MSEEMPIIPASITLIPNLFSEGSGSIEVSSPSDSTPRTIEHYSLNSSWRILGFVDVDLNSSWNIGQGSLRWYRVEGECGSVTCDEFGVEHRDCERMTFVTTVAAASVQDLCEILRNPKVNAPVTTKISSIKRYSRPVFKDQIQPDQCNVLSDVEFCQIPECFDYCVEDEESLSYMTSESDSFVPLELLSDAPEEREISTPAFSRSSCGCLNLGASISLKHNLSRSPFVSRFYENSRYALGDDFSIYYRSWDESWFGTEHARIRDETMSASWSLKCESDLLNLSLFLKFGSRSSLISVGVPGEVLCSPTLSSASVIIYIENSPRTLPLQRIVKVSTSPRPAPKSIVGSAEAVANGIFVPVLLYYDELGVFDGLDWVSNPLRLDLNASARLKASSMSLSGFVR